MYNSAPLWTAARQASLSFTISQSLLKLMSIESVMYTYLVKKKKKRCYYTGVHKNIVNFGLFLLYFIHVIHFVPSFTDKKTWTYKDV